MGFSLGKKPVMWKDKRKVVVQEMFVVTLRLFHQNTGGCELDQDQQAGLLLIAKCLLHSRSAKVGMV